MKCSIVYIKELQNVSAVPECIVQKRKQTILFKFQYLELDLVAVMLSVQFRRPKRI